MSEDKDAESFDIYKDDNPPNWPNNRTPFNRWYVRLHAFLFALQMKPFRWNEHSRFGDVKYLNIRVDTRNGGFRVFDDKDIEISPDELGVEFKPVSVVLEKQDDSTDDQNK